LGYVTEIDEDPVSFKGMGSEIQSKYPPILLRIQIGRVLLEGRFVVTDLLHSSPLLLGSDFSVKNKLWVAPYSDNSWFVNIGAIDKPLAKVPALITNKLTLCTKNELHFSPGEVKKIEIIFNCPKYENTFFTQYGCHPTVEE
jgi:hypothetical protein